MNHTVRIVEHVATTESGFTFRRYSYACTCGMGGAPLVTRTEATRDAADHIWHVIPNLITELTLEVINATHSP